LNKWLAGLHITMVQPGFFVAAGIQTNKPLGSAEDLARDEVSFFIRNYCQQSQKPLDPYRGWL
jgi:hypothetical protein